jgi:hypothetical protein
MYSFGRKKRYNMFSCGFVKENFNKGLFAYFPEADCCVLEISVTDKEYNIMYETVTQFCSNQEIYGYNIIGVLAYVLGVRLSRKDKFFCSQFVSYILSKADFWDFVPEFTKPMDFYNYPNKKLLFEGGIRDFGRYSYNFSESVKVISF